MSGHRCSERVWPPRQYGSSPCSRSGIVERDGKWYCRTHDPVAKAERDAKRTAEFNAKWEASKAEHLLNKAAPDMLAALEAAVECGLVPVSSVKDGGASKYSRKVEVADQIRAAIAKARGKTG